MTDTVALAEEEKFPKMVTVRVTGVTLRKLLETMKVSQQTLLLAKKEQPVLLVSVFSLVMKSTQPP
jgi:hypothetical protein